MNFSIGLSEIILMVNDVREPARFYREVVGLAPRTKPDDEWAWFWDGAPGEGHSLAVHKGLLFEQQSP